ncbi:type II toxin-antitoxin system YhaV family toxin, partial [Sulfitobacter pontiacus]|uniref:type II toxin-antitoxin system YhaV family toxin n=2 Tax=Pseudomonadota TaxID=1224 RepID=UPI0032988EAB
MPAGGGYGLDRGGKAFGIANLRHRGQGGTPGDPRKHWFRAKYFQQYRLFCRFNSDAKVIAVAWVNEDKTLCAYGSKTDAYATFKGMFEDGNPPDNFDVLLKEAAADKRFETSLEA